MLVKQFRRSTLVDHSLIVRRASRTLQPSLSSPCCRSGTAIPDYSPTWCRTSREGPHTPS